MKCGFGIKKIFQAVDANVNSAKIQRIKKTDRRHENNKSLRK